MCMCFMYIFRVPREKDLFPICKEFTWQQYSVWKQKSSTKNILISKATLNKCIIPCYACTMPCTMTRLVMAALLLLNHIVSSNNFQTFMFCYQRFLCWTLLIASAFVWRLILGVNISHLWSPTNTVKYPMWISTWINSLTLNFLWMFKTRSFPARNVFIKHLLLLAVVVLKMQIFSVRYACFFTQSRKLY